MCCVAWCCHFDMIHEVINIFFLSPIEKITFSSKIILQWNLMFRAISSVFCAGSLRTGSRLSELRRPARKLMNLTGYKKTEAWSMIARELNLMISCPTCFELLLASRTHGAWLFFPKSLIMSKSHPTTRTYQTVPHWPSLQKAEPITDIAHLFDQIITDSDFFI